MVLLELINETNEYQNVSLNIFFQTFSRFVSFYLYLVLSRPVLNSGVADLAQHYMGQFVVLDRSFVAVQRPQHNYWQRSIAAVVRAVAV